MRKKLFSHGSFRFNMTSPFKSCVTLFGTSFYYTWDTLNKPDDCLNRSLSVELRRLIG